jgi:hypothetical protein
MPSFEPAPVWLCEECGCVVGRGEDWSCVLAARALQDERGYVVCPRCGLVLFEAGEHLMAGPERLRVARQDRLMSFEEIPRYGFFPKEAPPTLRNAATSPLARSNADAWKQYAVQRERRCLRAAYEMCVALALDEQSATEVIERVSRLLGLGRGKHGLARPLRLALGLPTSLAIERRDLNGLKGRYATLNKYDERLVASILASVLLVRRHPEATRDLARLREWADFEPDEWAFVLRAVARWFGPRGYGRTRAPEPADVGYLRFGWEFTRARASLSEDEPRFQQFSRSGTSRPSTSNTR